MSRTSAKNGKTRPNLFAKFSLHEHTQTEEQEISNDIMTMKSCIKRNKIGSNNNEPKKAVCFGQIVIIEVPITLGDNPTTIKGIPVALSMSKPQRESMYDIEWYEAFRTKRRTRQELRICPKRRMQLVMMAGCSFREIDRAYAEIAKIQKHWSESVENWEILTTIGLDKTYHPSKLFPAAPRTTPPPPDRDQRRSRRFTPRLDREWEHDAENMSMANALA